MKINKAIVSSNNNPLYLDFWPIVRNAWLRLDITPVLVLIGEHNGITNDNGGIIHRIKEVPNVDSGFQAQISRMYVPKLYANDVCITSDIDMLPINYNYFHNFEQYNEDQILILSADATDFSGRYPMCYNVAKGEMYNKILDLECTFTEFTHRLLALDHGWDTDELYFTSKVGRTPDTNHFDSKVSDGWIAQHPNQVVKLNRGWDKKTYYATRRIDRATWKYDKSKVHDYIDCHMLRPFADNRTDLIELLGLIDKSLITPMLNFVKSELRSPFAGRFDLFIDTKENVVYKKIKQKIDNIATYKKIIYSVESDLGLCEYIFEPEKINIEDDGSYYSSYIKNGIRLYDITSSSTIDDTVLDNLKQSILDMKHKLNDYVKTKRLSGDWALHNLIYCLDTNKIYNIDLEGFYTYPLIHDDSSCDIKDCNKRFDKLLDIIESIFKNNKIDDWEKNIDTSNVVLPTVNYIPKIIHQTYSSLEKLRTDYKDYSERIKKLHPDYKYCFWSDDDMYNFVKTEYPHLYNDYMMLPKKIYKIDIFKYLVVHNKGGIFIDMDYEFYKPITPYINNKHVFLPISYEKGSLELRASIGKTKQANLNQISDLYPSSLFGSIKNYPFWIDLVENILKNQDYNGSDYSGPPGNAIFVTGPHILSKFYYNNKTKYENINKENDYNISQPQKNKHAFKQVAVHHCTHTWVDDIGRCHGFETEVEAEAAANSSIGNYSHSSDGMKKTVSFSLYTDKRIPSKLLFRYCDAAIRCVQHGRAKYKDWEWRFYIGDSVPQSTRNALNDLGCRLILMKGVPENYCSTLWRFYACEDSDIMISRDVDSVIMWREYWAVQEWLDSNRILHCMRDHSVHDVSILGGMWGIKGPIEDIREQIDRFPQRDYHGVDQEFLEKEVWPVFRDRSIAHVSSRNCLRVGDEFTDRNDRTATLNPNQAIELEFPTPLVDNAFVGRPWPPESHSNNY